jgi:hypothetical protein
MMNYAWIIPILLVLPSTLLADDMITAGPVTVPPPPYQPLRYNEDYLYLANQANRLDWFDSLKYIPLRTNSPSWYLTLGGELRERAEGNYNSDFGIGGAKSDTYLLQRISLLADLHLGDRVRFFAQGISGLMEGETPPAPPAQNDKLDLEFAFMDVVPYLTDDESLTLRTGRFGLSFGSGRLVDSRPPVNIDFRYDGIELLYTRPFWQATAFLTRPVHDNDGFSSADYSMTFWGLYVTHWFDAPHTQGLDLYYFGIHRQNGAYASGTGDEHRHTLGLREFGQWNHWDWDTEGAVQVGTFGAESILAWTVSESFGYTFDSLWQPRLGLKADITSGNSNPGNGRQDTFDALYFKNGYFNDASLIRPQNIIDIHPNGSLKITRAVSVDGGADVFWRYSRNDAVYGVPGNIAVPASSSASSYVGTALDVNLTWQIQRHLSLQASYVHFLAGNYIRQAGGNDVDYFSATLDFLF